MLTVDSSTFTYILFLAKEIHMYVKAPSILDLISDIEQCQ
jgi:hypothetical protein